MSELSGKSKRSIMGSILPKAKPPKEDPTDTVSFVEELEELRCGSIEGVAGNLIGVIVAFFVSEFLIKDFILGPDSADFVMYEFISRGAPFEAVDLDLVARRLPVHFFPYWGNLVVM